jgi:hypothetical protein
MIATRDCLPKTSGRALSEPNTVHLSGSVTQTNWMPTAEPQAIDQLIAVAIRSECTARCN